MSEADGRFDPLEAPGILPLLGRSSVVAFVSASNGIMVWHYDPDNRIFTPRFVVFKNLPDALRYAVHALCSTTDARAVLKTALDVESAEVEEREAHKKKEQRA